MKVVLLVFPERKDASTRLSLQERAYAETSMSISEIFRRLTIGLVFSETYQHWAVTG